MKKKIVLYMLIFSTLSVFSQINITGKYTTIKNPTGLNDIYIFSKIDNSCEIHYTSSDASVLVRWFQFINGTKTEINPSVLSSTETFISPKNNTGYIISVDDSETSFWVFDYSTYLFPANENIFAVTESDTPCENVWLNTNGLIPAFNYQNPVGTNFTLKREFDLIYSTLTWSKSSWNMKDTTIKVNIPPEKFSVPVPLTNTQFTLAGDQFSTDLGYNQNNITTPLYETKAIKCKITTLTSTRDALNENDRPKQETQLEGSAPLSIQFLSNPTPNVKNYFWKIFKNGELLLSRTEKDHQYLFNDAGVYKVKLEVSNDFCKDSATVDINVFESQLAAPKIFTPNDDGINDEFRVAYRSIIRFQGTILNRWGRVLFTWTDPAKGWNGKINGKPAADGTYFYVITAKGSDGKSYTLNGYTTLLR